MTAYELLTKDKIEEAQLHFKRGMEILDTAINSDICKKIDMYMKKPYTINTEKTDTMWAAKCVELCIEEYGKTEDTAKDNLQLRMIHYFKCAIENNEEIPKPQKS